MKILLIGEAYRNTYPELMYNNFVKLGIEMEKINTSNFFKVSLLNRIVNKFLKTPHYFGSGVKMLNRITLEKALKGGFDCIVFVKPTLIYPETIVKLKEKLDKSAKIVGLTLDPPDFFNYHSDYFYKSIPLFDWYITGRQEDGEAMNTFGAKKTLWFLFGADTACHYPVDVSAEEKKKIGADIIFCGSYAKGERRVNYLEKLCRDGYDVKIYGNAWDWYRLPWNSCLRKKNKIIPGSTPCEEMSKVINASKIILAFMRDTMGAKIGMRTSEIPLCKGFMMHQRTKRAEEFLVPDREAVFFGDYEEMKEKIDFYLKNPELRREIAEAGYRRVLNCGSLCNDVVKKIVSILKNEQ